MSMKLHFLGAAGTVVPSRYILQNGSTTMLDCGSAIHDDDADEKVKSNSFDNIESPVIDSLLLSHGHTDHVGASPDLVQQKKVNRVFGTAATLNISETMLRDNFAGSLIDNVSGIFEKPKHFKKEFQVADGVYATFYPAQGHILGASSILIRLEKENLRVLFSGDLGNTNKYMLDNTVAPPEADVVIMESTYGRREHHQDFQQSLKSLYNGINSTYENNGNYIIPVLSINRLQEILFYINEARANGDVYDDINLVVDSNLGRKITEIYSRKNHRHMFSDRAKALFDAKTFYPFQYSTDFSRPHRNVFVVSSGLDGLRGKLPKYMSLAEDPNNSFAVVSHTIEGSPLDDIKKGKAQIGKNGTARELNAKTFNLDGFSSHPDATQLLTWLEKTKASIVYLVHGDDTSRIPLKQMIVDRGLCLEENIHLPTYEQEVDLSNLPKVNGSSAIRTPTPKAAPVTLFGHELSNIKAVTTSTTEENK